MLYLLVAIPQVGGILGQNGQDRQERRPKKVSNDHCYCYCYCYCLFLEPMLSDIKSSFTNCICRMLKALDNTPRETTVCSKKYATFCINNYNNVIIIILEGKDGVIIIWRRWFH